jgi:hypothetical protein
MMGRLPMANDYPTPDVFGLPYEAWRPGQWELIQAIADSPQRFHLVVAPTGFGKSLLYMALGKLVGIRAVMLTATKALQDQLNRDFGGGSDDGNGPLGLYDVRGKSAYPCTLAKHLPQHAHMVRPSTTASTAPCRWGFPCPMRDAGGCPYYDRVKWADKANLLVTNYDFWLYNPNRRGKTDLLVMDEAHQAPAELGDYFSFKLTRDHLRYFDKRHPQAEEVDGWMEWFTWAEAMVKGKLESYRGQKPPDDLLELASAIDKMARLGQGEWVIERLGDGSWAFDCINPEQFGRYLWGGVEKVVMVSATANIMTAQAIGIDPGEIKVWEADSSFPVERRLVWAVNGAVRLNFRTSEGEKECGWG